MGSHHSRFAKDATAEEVASQFDITSKLYVVTGGNTGLGLETVRVLASRGARVITGVRRPDVTETAINALELPQEARERIEILPLDLSSLDSVLNFSQELRSRPEVLDGLVLNAGVMALPEYIPTADGFESQWGINHFGHFTLTLLLLPRLVAKQGPTRVVSVSSQAHLRSPRFRAEILPPSRERYDPFPNYGLSKLSNILFANALNERLQDRQVTAYSLHPGVIPTDLGRNNSWATFFYESRIARFFMKTIPQGASTQVYCLLEDAAQAPPGHYYLDNHQAEAREDAASLENATQLWDISLRLLHEVKPNIFDIIRDDHIVSLDHILQQPPPQPVEHDHDHDTPPAAADEEEVHPI